jgi:hypothetical protein
MWTLISGYRRETATRMAWSITVDVISNELHPMVLSYGFQQ